MRALVRDAGFTEPQIEDVPVTWRYESLDHYWAVTADLSFLLTAVLEVLDPEVIDEVRARVGEELQPFTDTSGALALPGLCRNVLARRRRAREDPPLQDRLAERARDELDGEICRRVLPVEDRVHLDHLERTGKTGFGHQLQRQMRLSVGEAAANRRPDTRGDLRVEHVEIERHVHERRRR